MSSLLVFYTQVKWVHVHAVICSGTLFALRCGASLFGARWPRHWLPRYLSYSIDTVLLTAATMLYSMLPAGMFTNHWLTVKLILVVVYIGLGMLAMRAQLPLRRRALLYAAALLTFVSIYGIARMHHPAGWWLLVRPV